MSLTKTPLTRSLTILLVEDEKEMANEIKNELEGRGYLVRTASIRKAADAVQRC
jgi:CheY-like chemotaxis protein